MSESPKRYEIPTLTPEDIEVKVKQISSKGALALLYKTARTDMEYLDKVFGVGNWQCDYKEIKGNLYCTIQIWDDTKNQWVSKVDCGIESREDDEGNQKKGEASDAFKRAGFKVGIGRELYSSPFIWLTVETEQDKNGRWQLKDRFAKFDVAEIGYDINRKINLLRIIEVKTGKTVYEYGVKKSTKPKEAKEAPKQEAPKKDIPKEAPKPVAKAQATNAVVTTTATLPQDENTPEYLKIYRAFLTKHKLNKEKFAELRLRAVQDKRDGITDKSFRELTENEWLDLLGAMEHLYAEGYYKESA